MLSCLALDGKLDVGPVEAKHLRFHTPAEQPRRDVARVASSAVAVSAMIGTSGKMPRSRDRCFIFAPERRPPLRDAMRLVDGDQADIEPGQRIQHPLGHQPFRREIEQARLARRDRRHAATLASRSIEELIVSAATPASRNAATWSCISATSGDTTMVSPPRTSAGTW